MTEHEINMAIAKVKGWSDFEIVHQVASTHSPHGWLYGLPPNTQDNERILTTVPYYTRDLNAMHEAEKILMTGQMVECVEHLIDIVQNSREDKFKHRELNIFIATASQRCEAFLKTLGLWKV